MRRRASENASPQVVLAQEDLFGHGRANAITVCQNRTNFKLTLRSVEYLSTLRPTLQA